MKAPSERKNTAAVVRLLKEFERIEAASIHIIVNADSVTGTASVTNQLR